MGPRLRMAVLVASLATTAAVVVVGGALLQSSGDDETQTAPAPQRPTGTPPLFLDLGARDDFEAAELRRAERFVAQGKRREAAAIFARDRSVNGRVGAALAAWPDGTLAALQRLARERPRSALVRLHLGIAQLWAGRTRAAQGAWQEARRVEPDSLSAVRAGDLLFPNAPRGLPTFVPSFEPPAALQDLAPPEQLDKLHRDAIEGGWRQKVLYGVALQRLGRRVSAQEQFDAAARAAPAEPEALTAAALAVYDKAEPARAFSRLGPLARRFPRSPTVRFHLGLALLWLGQVDEGKRQLRLARAAGPRTPLGREAARFLARLGKS